MIAEIAVIIAVIWFFSKKENYMARGLRNNNPGNIRINDSINYVGEVKPSQDSAFKQFIDMEHGYRAMFVDLRAKINRGVNTIYKIINVWAPESDGNNTDAYVRAVSDYVGIDPDQEFSFEDEEIIKDVVKAMSKVENGVVADVSKVNQGYNLV